MNEKTKLVFRGWLELTADEQQQLSHAIRQYNEKLFSEQRALQADLHKSVTRMQTGPLGQTCPCCGR